MRLLHENNNSYTAHFVPVSFVMVFKLSFKTTFNSVFSFLCYSLPHTVGTLFLHIFATGTLIPDFPFSSFDPSRDYGMDLCLEVYLWTIYPYFTTFRVVIRQLDLETKVSSNTGCLWYLLLYHCANDWFFGQLHKCSLHHKNMLLCGFVKWRQYSKGT